MAAWVDEIMTGYFRGEVISNIPTPTPQFERFIVARLVDTEYWYYGTYYDLERAMRVAKQVHGEVFDLRDLLLADFKRKEEKHG